MNVTRDTVTNTEVTLTISMDAEDEEPFLNRSYRRVASRVRIPGFRPGKAPRSIVESHMGREALVHEALEFMIPESLDKVLKDEDIQAFMEPRLEVIDMAPVSFKAVVPLEPIVELGEFQSIRLDKEEVEVTDEQVEHVLEDLRFESAPWEPVDRPVAFGDLVTLNVKGNIGGEQAIEDEGIDFIPQEDNNLPLPGFSANLEGMSEGESKEFTLNVPDDYPQQEYAGKECRFDVDVISIKAKSLPELDDEFAKGVREGFESLEALSNHVRQRLHDEAEAAANRRMEQSSLDEIKKLAKIQASELVYERELDLMYEERERALRNQRMDMELYLSYMGQTAEELREQMKPQAEDRLNTMLLLRKLADVEEIEVSDEEVQAEIDNLIASNGGDSEDSTMRQALSTQNALDSIRSGLLNRKIMARLVEITQGKASAAPAAEAPTESSIEEPQADTDNEAQPEDESTPAEDAT
ncbi:MAG: trigger factor [Chloroflexi bacterium]|nr:trigger factor [Chloroflexota bacterium]MDA1271142.1 trigger factor [Chloroflexota bacterium]PKB58708.1 MAG: trigger factor [SAR202 cluster bacterium Casp-Chloro-G2]